MARLWAQTVTFHSVNPGDQLPILVKWETWESMLARRARLGQTAPEAAGEEEAEAEPTLDPAALVSYVTELLAKAFPPDSITAPGSKLEVEHLAPVRPNDTMGFSGEVVSKRQEGGRGLVECAIVVENQEGETVGRAAAIVSLDLDSGGQDAPGVS
jgi:acyl dehydratase